MLFTQHTPNASAPDLLYPDQCYNAVELNLPCAEPTEFAVAEKDDRTMVTAILNEN